jgi:hypothetical protein
MPTDLEALVGDLYGAPRRQAQQSAIAAIDQDPDEAGRALDLEGDTGVPAQTIQLDQDGFEQRHQAQMISSLVANNTQLQDYINSHPMAPRVSNGDWGNLDTFSAKLHQFGAGVLQGLRSPDFMGGESARSVMTAAVQGYVKGYGDQPYGDWILQQPTDAEIAANPAELDRWRKELELAKKYPMTLQSAKDLLTIPEMFTRAYGGALEGLHEGIKQAYIQTGGSENDAERFAREVAGMAEYHFMQQGPEVVNPAMHEFARTVDITGLAPHVAKAARAAETYIKAGEEPAWGVNPAIDEAKKAQTDLDFRNYDAALEAAVKTATRERAPDLLANFARQHTEDSTIGIPAEAILKLYGDKPPAPDDGILGWVPGLADKVAAASEFGGDVEIPLHDWLARVDPEVADSLHDDLRLRTGYPTLNEIKEPPRYDTALDPFQVLADEDPVSLVRREAALDRSPLGWGTVEGLTNDEKLAQLTEMEPRGFDVDIPGGQTKVRFIPTEELTAHEAEVTDAVNKELERIVPRGVTRPEGGAIKTSVLHGREVRGVYRQFTDQLPLILWSLDATDPLGTARHEAIHHLRQAGFFTPEEWTTLSRASRDEGWLDKYGIKDRYRGKGAGLQLEESIAEAFKHWKRDGEPPVGIAGRIFAKLGDFLDRIKSRIRGVLGYEPTWQDIFHKVERGEVGRREGTQPLDPRSFRETMADEPIFEKAKAVGMTEDQYRRWIRGAEKKMAADQKLAQDRAAKEIQRRMGKEYQAAKVVHEAEATRDINNRPDIIADEFLRLGRLGNQKIKGTARLYGKYLTKEQKKALHSSHWDANEGLHPDDVASLAGFHSGEAMVNRLMMLENARGGMKPYEWKAKLIKAETEVRLKKQFGNLDEAVLREAREHAISQSQIDMLHEETLAAAAKSGSAFPISKDEMKSWAKEAFDKLPVSQLSMVKFLQLAGKYGTMAEQELLRGKPVEGFRFKQMQYRAMLLSQEAKRFERSMATFERTAKRFSKRSVDGIPQEYTDRMHEVLQKVGRPIGRSVQDLQSHLGTTSLADWQAHKRGFYMREIDIHPDLLDPKFNMPVKALTGEQADGLFKTVANLLHNARDEGQIIRAGEKMDLDQFKKDLKDQISTFPEKRYDLVTHQKASLGKTLKKYGYSHLQIEALLARWDRGDPNGPWSQGVMRPLTEAANSEAAMQREVAKMLKALKDDVDPEETIPNTLFRYQNGINGGDPIRMTRSSLRRVMLDTGNRSNLEKRARGYQVDPGDVMSFVHRNATKEDWEWVQGVWDIFAHVKAKADLMYSELAGIEPEAIPHTPIDTPFGRYNGGYYPVIYDRLQEGTSEKLMGGDALEQQNYVRATTPQGHFKTRTGYIAPMEMTLDMMPARLKAMIHDVTFRPAVINASKIFYSRDVRAAITRHVGDIPRDLLVPYLKDVANAANYRDDLGYTFSRVSEFIRQNVISTMIGWNPGTVMKHGLTAGVNSITEVGPVSFANAVRSLFSINDSTGETNFQFALAKSEELQRRHANWTETLGGATGIATASATKFETLRQTLMKAGATPVAVSDLMTAIPTWLAKYKEMIDEGRNEGDSIAAADLSVRRAHGSTVITNRPAIMRSSSPLAQWITSLYGFFSHVFNRQYELMWRASDALGMAKSGDLKGGLAQVPKLTAMFFSYVVFPALIEELVTPATNKEHESWGKWGAKMLLQGVSSSFPLVRDIVYAAVNGRDPSFGLISTAEKVGTDIFRDLDRGKEAFSKPHAGKLIRDGVTALGALTGTATAPMGKAAEYAYDYAKGMEHPKGPWGVATGLRFGQGKGHSPTLYDRMFTGKVQR